MKINKIEKILPVAIDTVKEVLVMDNKIDKEFNGYISSFGSSIISAGLLPTLVFFSQKGESSSDRTKIIIALEKMLKQTGKIPREKPFLVYVKELIEGGDKSLEELNKLSKEIQNSIIAMKLAIRIFPKNDKNN